MTAQFDLRPARVGHKSTLRKYTSLCSSIKRPRHDLNIITWKPVDPGGPGGPLSPDSPGGPEEPGGPGAPSLPESPRGPVGPGGPGKPSCPASPCRRSEFLHLYKIINILFGRKKLNITFPLEKSKC